MASRLRKKAKGWGARIRFGERMSRDEWIALDIPHDQEALAEDRLTRLQVMGKRLSDLGKHAEVRLILEEAGATRHERGFRAIESMVEDMSPERVAQRTPRTFRQVAQDLCDGTLHELHPDEIGHRAKQGQDARRALLSVFFPVLGDKTFTQISRDDIDEAKRLIPKDVKQNRRVTYCKELRYVMRLAVEPLRLCEHVPNVSVPKETETDLFQLLYPDEEEQVAGATVAVSIEERFLYAFLVRNGPRISEALQYTWDAVDLERGKIRVAAAWTKTGRARFWDLEPDVTEALRLRRAMIPKADLVFVPPPLRVFTRQSVYHQLKLNLRAAGLTRPELFKAPKGERALTTHDLRGSFVTVARTLGMSDRWIRDRSGHESPKTLERYDRGVRHAREQGLGWWAPMALALGLPGAQVKARLGEVSGQNSSGPKGVQSWAKAPQMPIKTETRTNRCALVDRPTHPVNPVNFDEADPSITTSAALGPAAFSISGQNASTLSADDLRELLALATQAGRWHLVTSLGEALRLQAEERPKVASLDAARARREREGRS